MSVLSPSERNKLIGLLGMLGSDFPGERANAGSLATKLIRDRGLTWGDLVQPALPSNRQHAPQDPADGEAAARLNVRFCLRHFHGLTAWEQEFVSSVANRARISDRQAAILRQAADKLRKRGFA